MADNGNYESRFAINQEEDETVMTGKPTHIAYSVRDFEKDGKPDALWSRIGVAFAHKDGKGFDVTLDALPVSGRVVLRVNEPKPQA